MIRHKEQELRTEQDLDYDARLQDHLRLQRLKNVMNWVSIWIAVCVVFVAFLLWLYLIYQYIRINNLEKIEYFAISVIVFIAGYMLRYLQQNGLWKK